jgi:isopentenyl diphosphate isomerase/L-lactate dehydrogenase-like FMN-dependent dehydrogenase
MKQSVDEVSSRRLFLRFLAGSPVLAYLGLSVSWPEGLWAWERPSGSRSRSGSFSGTGELIRSPSEAINIFDFQEVAQHQLPTAHYGYLATGVDDDSTLKANRQGFTKFQIRMRRLVDVRQVDTSTEILGAKMETPIITAPVASQTAFHPDGELAVARAAKKKGFLQILSTVSTKSVEEVAGATGGPIWFQLYPTPEWRIAEAIVKRAEDVGCPVLVLTVDLQGGSNRETLKNAEKADSRDCSTCHQEGLQAYLKSKPMFDGLDVSALKGFHAPAMTWDFVHRLKDQTNMKLVLKGIVTREDARLSVENGVDAVIVSNHGGRAESSGRSTIECLPEVLDGISGRIPVLIDSGFRRGTDIFKALALGAQGVCIGRPYLWGLAAFGQEGVEAVLDILRAELEMVMKQAGTTSMDKITSSSVVSAM